MAEEGKIAGEGLAGEQDEKDHDAEFDEDRMKEKIKMLEISDKIKGGLADTRVMLEALKADLEAGWPIVDRLLSTVPKEDRFRMTRDMAMKVIEAHEDDRRMRENHGEVWKHPISVHVNTSYYKCAECGAKLGDEIAVVVERLRGGDKIRTFCDRECLAVYAINHWEVEE